VALSNDWMVNTGGEGLSGDMTNLLMASFMEDAPSTCSLLGSAKMLILNHKVLA